MKKKIVAVALCAAMVLSLAGCSKELSNDNVTIKQYEGLEVAKVEQTEVTDDSVEQVVEGKLQATATSDDTKDKKVKDGDTVDLNYKGTVDGVEFEGGAQEGASLELGSGTFIPANGDYKSFEEQIVGHKIGETFDITVKFPTDYNEEMADKVAVFNIKLNGIITTPELTDEWVKSNSEESKTVEEYKKEIKKQLKEQNKESTDNTLQSQVLEALAAQVEVKKYPDGEVDKQIESIKTYYTGMAQAYGVEFKDFLDQYMGMTEDDFNKQAKEAAEGGVKKQLACELIAEKKKLAPTDKEYEEQIEKYAKDSGYEKVEDFTKEVGEDTIKSTILQQKVAEYLVEKCVQVEQKEETPEAATE